MTVTNFLFLKKWIRKHFELVFWVSALIFLFFLPVQKSATSFCAFSLLGFGKCPGCGIGHSIHYALRLDLQASFQHHPLGIFAVMIIFRRIKQLIYPSNQTNETQSDQSHPIS